MRNNRTSYIFRIVAGAYLAYLGVQLVTETLEQKPTNATFNIIMGVFFGVVGLWFAVGALIHMFKEQRQERAESGSSARETEKEAHSVLPGAKETAAAPLEKVTEESGTAASVQVAEESGAAVSVDVAEESGAAVSAEAAEESGAAVTVDVAEESAAAVSADVAEESSAALPEEKVERIAVEDAEEEETSAEEAEELERDYEER